MITSLKVLDVDTLKRVITLIEAKGLVVDKSTSVDIQEYLYRELKSVDKVLLEEYCIENAGNASLVSCAFDVDKVDKQYLLNEGSELAKLIMKRRSLVKKLGKVKAFNGLELLGGRVFWRHEMTPFLRTESRDYNVQLMPMELRSAVKPSNEFFVNVVYNELEVVASALGSGDDGLFGAYDKVVGNAVTLSAFYGVLYGGSLFEVSREIEKNFAVSEIGGKVRDGVLAVTLCRDYIDFVMELKERADKKSGNATLFGRYFGKTEKHVPAYYFLHGSCQDLLDMTAASMFDRFGGGVDVALVDHHSVLLDCQGLSKLDEIREIATLEVYGRTVVPELRVGENYQEVSSERPSVPLLYGKWS